jgi:prepilin-type N-terminal cleavage/methylation domain-containing protein
LTPSAAPPRTRPAQRGFTLLEVLIALTICATALAFLFAVVAGSKDLTFRANQALKRGDEVRRLATLSRLVDPAGELLVPAPESDYRVELEAEELEIPERKTATTTQAIRQYEIRNADGDVAYRGYYWITLEEPE